MRNQEDKSVLFKGDAAVYALSSSGLLLHPTRSSCSLGMQSWSWGTTNSGLFGVLVIQSLRNCPLVEYPVVFTVFEVATRLLQVSSR